MSGGMILQSLISVISELDTSKKLKLGSFYCCGGFSVAGGLCSFIFPFSF